MASTVLSPWIFTTTKCNLSCPYCYVKQTGEDMDLVTYQKINEICLKMLDSGEKERIVYRMAGGEPLLVFDNWKDPVQEFLDKASSKGFVGVLTNLTCLTDKMIDFFKDKNIGFSVSLDGWTYSKPYHNGKSSAKKVRKNIDKLIQIGKRDLITISTVINKDSFDDIDKLAEWIADRNLNWTVELDHFFCGEMPLETVVLKMKQVIDILKAKDFDLVHRFCFGNMKVSSSYQGCTAGDRLITIFVNGDVFPCQTTIYKEPICNIFTSENILTDLENQKIYQLGANWKLPEPCQNCAISDICGGGCKENNREINKNYTCDILKIVFLYLLQVVMTNKEEE